MSVRVRVVTLIESRMRTRAFAPLCAALSLVLVACAPAKQELRNEFESTLAVDGAAPGIVTRQLDAGNYLVEVRESDIDLQLVVDAPRGHSESTDTVPRHGLLHAVVSLEAPGEVRIMARSGDHKVKKGTAQLRIARWLRGATGSPSALEKGYAALAKAGELTLRQTPADSLKAIDVLHEAIGDFEVARAKRERTRAQYTLANLYIDRGDNAGALRAADDAAQGFDAADDEVDAQNAAVTRAIAEMGLAYAMDASKQGAEKKAMFDAASRRLREAAEFFDAHAMPVRAAFVADVQGVHSVYVADYDAAARYLQQAVEMNRANQDPRDLAISLANLAWVHYRRGFFARAASEYEALLPMIEQEKEPYQYAAALGNYGFCLIALGEFDRALALHNQALAMYASQGKEVERGAELNALGTLYLQVGDAERALEILRTAIASHERLGDAALQVYALRVAANAASALGQHEVALGYLRKASQIDTTQHAIDRTRVLIARELQALGDLDGAEAELKTAIDSKVALVRADAFVERARLRSAQHRQADAIADLRAADLQYVALSVEFNRIETNTELAHALLAAGDVVGAGAAADAAVSIASGIRAKSANPEWRAHFVSSQYSPYEARIAVDLAGGGPQAAWRAFQTAEKVRARSLADQLAVGPRDEIARTQTEDLRAKLTSLQLDLESRIQKGASDGETTDLRRGIAETRAQLDATRAAVTAREQSLSDTLERVQAGLPRDTAVLAYFVGDADSHAWLLTRNALRHQKLAGMARLQKEIVSAIGAQGANAGSATATRALGKLLFGNLLDGVAESRLLLIPDGVLHAVPFAAISTGADQLLVERFTISYAPSLTLAMNGPRRAATHLRVAVVSDPVYAPDDRRMHVAMGEQGGTMRGTPQPSPGDLTRLAYSGMETRAVLAALGAKNAITLAGFDATPSRVYGLPFNELSVLHFATHAVSRPDSPEQSALYLSGYAADGSRLADSRITVSEIARRGLRADVVVLSGCATGDGSELRGEGVLGLTYAFLANESGAVIASLWPIEDASTARFMKEFYGAYRANPQPAEALHLAQLRSRNVVKSTVWSSFVVRANGFP
jgi:CHAT domain-containing protein/tetratricopeptide (TPR) repeat protein